MDIKKLCEKVLSREEVKNIPKIFIYIVIKCVLDAIGSGECFYETEFE